MSKIVRDSNHIPSITSSVLLNCIQQVVFCHFINPKHCQQALHVILWPANLVVINTQFLLVFSFAGLPPRCGTRFATPGPNITRSCLGCFACFWLRTFRHTIITSPSVNTYNTNFCSRLLWYVLQCYGQPVALPDIGAGVQSCPAGSIWVVRISICN